MLTLENNTKTDKYRPHPRSDRELRPTNIWTQMKSHNEPTSLCQNCGKSVKQLQGHVHVCNPSEQQFSQRKGNICGNILSFTAAIKNHIKKAQKWFIRGLVSCQRCPCQVYQTNYAISATKTVPSLTSDIRKKTVSVLALNCCCHKGLTWDICSPYTP